MATAYADIDGYTADENESGTVICRIWLLNEKRGIYPTYLVDWHYDAYRMNKSVLELVAQAKNDLKRFKQDMVDEVFAKAYERYKLQWMLDHNHTLSELLDILQSCMDETGDINNAFNTFECDTGFRSELWACEDEFLETEWENDDYMQRLLAGDEYAIYKMRD